MHTFDMQWFEENSCRLCCALLRCSALQFSEGWPSSGSHAGAQGSCVRARLGACCGTSCVAGMLAPLSAIILARRQILLLLAARTRPSPMWYFTHVASAGFLFLVPASRLWRATGAMGFNGVIGAYMDASFLVSKICKGTSC